MYKLKLHNCEDDQSNLIIMMFFSEFNNSQSTQTTNICQVNKHVHIQKKSCRIYSVNKTCSDENISRQIKKCIMQNTMSYSLIFDLFWLILDLNSFYGGKRHEVMMFLSLNDHLCIHIHTYTSFNPQHTVQCSIISITL